MFIAFLFIYQYLLTNPADMLMVANCLITVLYISNTSAHVYTHSFISTRNVAIRVVATISLIFLPNTDRDGFTTILIRACQDRPRE